MATVLWADRRKIPSIPPYPCWHKSLLGFTPWQIALGSRPTHRYYVKPGNGPSCFKTRHLTVRTYTFGDKLKYQKLKIVFICVSLSLCRRNDKRCRCHSLVSVYWKVFNVSTSRTVLNNLEAIMFPGNKKTSNSSRHGTQEQRFLLIWCTPSKVKHSPIYCVYRRSISR